MASNKLGSWAFIAGLVLAVLLGLGLGAGYEVTLIWILFIVGVVVGVLNVTARETDRFLTAGTVLALVAFLGSSVGVFSSVAVLQNILRGILTLFVPATIGVALNAVYEVARD